MHKSIEPGILYLGTPVVLIGTENDDGSYNLAPMSSAFWLGWRCLLGLGAASKTSENMRRTGECVLNLPSVDCAAAVNLLACTTGTNPVPEGKVRRGLALAGDEIAQRIAALGRLPAAAIVERNVAPALQAALGVAQLPPSWYLQRDISVYLTLCSSQIPKIPPPKNCGLRRDGLRKEFKPN